MDESANKMNNQQKYETAILQKMANLSNYLQEADKTGEGIEAVHDELRAGLMSLEYAEDHEELGEEITAYLEPDIDLEHKPDEFDTAINLKENGSSYNGP
jgi:hypothetical protein